ncbi:MAG: phosphate regulon transcriptional regulator PhoB [Alphaproteobacteria bacterium]|nr:phosphate regulon transcriptional regulator PhoB [Alphaproteobacteria bacterium]MBQ8346928.1 phosphate regulon transcriptional regulator PhoB [Alphaproteobacteria bacterium]
MTDKIMIIEDEEDIVTLLRYNLEKEGFETCAVTDGEKAFNAIKINQPTLILLDWMLPGLSGVEICKQVRYDNDLRNVPIIMLTARGEEADKIKGLTIGADDYMTKPFSVPELIARIRALMRRVQPVKTKGELVFEDIKMDLATCRVFRGDRFVHLGPTEFRLLQFLMEQPRHVFPREQLLKEVWGADIHVELRTVDVHIRRLRKAMNEGGEPDLIRTVRAAGYSIDSQQPGDPENDEETAE